CFSTSVFVICFFFFFQAEDGIRDRNVTGVQTCALPISRHEVARREQPFFPGRAEPQEQLAERDHPRHGVLPRWRRASATRSTNDRARAVSSAAEPSASRAALASALPTLTAAAPARIQSPAFSSDTPPEGTSRRKGSGTSTSRMEAGPTAEAGDS